MARARRGQHETAGGRRVAILAALATLLVGLLLTGGVAVLVRQGAHRSASDGFVQGGDQLATALESEVATYFTKLDDIAAFLANHPNPTAQDVDGFVRGAKAFEQLPSLAGVFYLARVPDESFAGFVARQQAADPSFTILQLGTPDPGATRYLLVHDVAGPTGFAVPVGVDLTGLHSVTDALRAADRRDVGVAASFQHDPLLQQIARDTEFPLLQQLLDLDFFMGVPVIARRDDPVAGVKAGDTMGWVGAPITNFADVAASAGKGQPRSLGLRLTVDLTDADLADRDELSRVAEQPGTAGASDLAAFTRTSDFQVDGVHFDVVVWSTADAADVPPTVPITLVVGAFASLLAAAVVYLRLRALDRERALAAAADERAQFQREIVDSVATAMVVLDPDGTIVAANRAWADLRGSPSGFEAKVLLRDALDHPARDGGTPYVEVMRPIIRGDDGELAEAMQQVLAREVDAVELDLPIEQEGVRRWFAMRATPLRSGRGGAVVVHTDITERKRSQDDLEFRANRDNLTGLLNRRAFEAETDAALAHARLHEHPVAALFIDLDGFKSINDTHGHAAGDEVLREVGRRVGGAVRATDRVGRLGGDEFVVLIAPLERPEVAEATATRILDALAPTIEGEGFHARLRASIGIAIVEPTLGMARAALLDHADHAMYEAKQEGGGRYVVSR